MKTSDKPLVVYISTWLHSLRKVKSTQASRVSFKSNWIDISIEPLFISCHTLQWRVDIKNAKNAPDSVTCLAAPTLYRVSSEHHTGRPEAGHWPTWCRANNLLSLLETSSCSSFGDNILFVPGHVLYLVLCEAPVQISAFLQWALDKVIWSLEKCCVLPEIKKGLKPPSPLILPLLKLMMGGFKERGKSVICEIVTQGGLTPGCIVLASLTSTIWTEFLSLSPKHVMVQILPRLQCKVDIFIDIAPLVHHLVF